MRHGRRLEQVPPSAHPTSYQPISVLINPSPAPKRIGVSGGQPNLDIPQAVQKGRPARPQRAKRRIVDYSHPPIACRNSRLPRPYVEPLSDARTPLAAFINSLLSAPVLLRQVCDRSFRVFRRNLRMTGFPMLNGLFQLPDPCLHMRSLAGLLGSL
jgi:hypothetical protein